MAAQQTSKQEQTNEGRWNLADVLPSRSGEIFQKEILDRLESMIVEFENIRALLIDTISQKTFLRLIENYEEIVRIRARLGSYAYMLFSEDTRSQEARAFKSRAEEIDADSANRTLFFELWFKSLSSEKTGELISGSKKYAYFLERLIQTKPYTLSEPVEQALNLKNVTGRDTVLQLYHQVRDSFSYDVVIRGETKKLREEQVRDLFHSAKREEREAAYRSMLSRFEQNSDLIGEMYKSLVRDWKNEGVKLRKYGSPISVRNVSNDVPDEAVATLLETCKRNAPLFHRFFALKSKVTGIKDFSRFDVYSPFPNIKEKTYSWEEGMRLVLSTFDSFDHRFASLAENLFTQRHFDREVREGKIGGAYCMSITPEITPYILISYTGNPRSVTTLAHELGHSIHSQLSGSTNNQLTFEPPLPLAETASVFGELLLTDRLLAESDNETRKSILLEMINDAYGTILRQSFFVLFEREAHEKIPNAITIDQINELYRDNLKSQFGDSLQVPEEFRFEWLSIPHIFASPFYCYSYAWGNLLVMALYRQYREEGAKTFAPRYMKMLSHGGSKAPERILDEAGFNIRSKAFWQSGFDELERSLTELKSLVS